MPKRFHGVLAIVHTPFTMPTRSMRLHFKRAVDWAFAVGADGLGTGMVSEMLKLTTDERLLLAAMLVEFAAGRGPVFVAVGAESTKQSLAFAVAAEKAGCDAVMAVPPLTSKLGEAHLVDHFRALADAIAIPVIVQDASGYVGQSIPIGVCVKLLERYGPEKILFKPEAAPIGPTLSALRDATGGRAVIFEGSGGIFLIDSYPPRHRRHDAGHGSARRRRCGLACPRARRRGRGVPHLLPHLRHRRPATAGGARRLPGGREVPDGQARPLPDRAAADRTAGSSTPRPPPRWTGCSRVMQTALA